MQLSGDICQFAERAGFTLRVLATRFVCLNLKKFYGRLAARTTSFTQSPPPDQCSLRGIHLAERAGFGPA